MAAKEIFFHEGARDAILRGVRVLVEEDLLGCHRHNLLN